MQVLSTAQNICIAIDIRPCIAAPCPHHQEQRRHPQRDPKQGPSAAMRSCLGAVAEESRGSAEPAELVAAGLHVESRGRPGSCR